MTRVAAPKQFPGRPGDDDRHRPGPRAVADDRIPAAAPEPPTYAGGYPSMLGGAAEKDDFIDLERVWTMVRRQMWLVALCVAIAAVLGIVYLRMTPLTYVSSAEILVDRNIDRVVGDDAALPVSTQADEAISTQMVVLGSLRLAAHVVRSQNLLEDPVFQNAPRSASSILLQPLRTAAGYLKGTIGGEEPVGGSAAGGSADPDGIEDERVRAAAERLRESLYIERIGRSQAIRLTYNSWDPELAHRIVQAYTLAYVEEQRSTNANASGQATDWMQQRLAELREELRQAGQAVEVFRAENGLSSASGELISEQQLSQLTSELVRAQGELAQAEARSNQINAVVSAGPSEAARSLAGTTDPVVNDLRTRLADIQVRLDAITSRYGEDHLQAERLRSEQQDIQDQLFRELQRLAEVYRNDVDVARSRYEALEETVGEQTGTTAVANQALVRLRALEQRAETLNALYGNLLARYEEMMYEQTFPVSNLRVISAPTIPREPAGPSFSSTMAVALSLGLVLGGLAGALREFNERYFRTGAQLETELGVRFLGYLPLAKRGRARRLLSRMRNPFDLPMPASVAAAYRETLRNVRLAAERSTGGTTPVLGVVSALPGEGKSTVSFNLARLLAATGSRVVLVDGDMHNPGLTRALAPGARSGLAEAVEEGSFEDHVLHMPSAGGLTLLPTLEGTGMHHGSALLASPAMADLVADLTECFDHVIVDLPPCGPVVDAKAFEPFADSFLFVVQWGGTPRSLVHSVLNADREIRDKLVGAVLNKTDLDRLPRYGDRGSAERMLKSYQSYFVKG